MTPRITHASEIAPDLSFERLIPALARAFRDYFDGHARIAPITNIDLPSVNGEMHIKPGYFADGDHVCVKIATCYYDNPSRGLPTRDGVVVLANRKNGRIEAVLCESGLITDMRTAGSSAVAVDALARPGPITLGLVGVGTQAYWHAKALLHVRPIERVLVWGRRQARVTAGIERIASATKLNVTAGTIDEVAACDVVVTATPASTPVLTEQALRPGALVVAMGADAAGKRELDPRILEQASLIVADSLDQCRAVGELQWLDKPDEKRVVELGAILCGAQAGRQTADDIIIFDSTGMGFQDVVGASQVLIAQQKR
jgi:ornithine cyclodeaminase